MKHQNFNNSAFYCGLLIRKPLVLCYNARVNTQGTLNVKKGRGHYGWGLCNNIALTKNLLQFNLECTMASIKRVGSFTFYLEL